MTSAYLNIRNITSFQTILDHFKRLKNNDIISFFDYDDNIINVNNGKIIEPDVTKELFNYMIKNNIFFAIITGRFSDTVCDDFKRNLWIMQQNIIYTIYPTLMKLGMDVSSFLTEESKKTIHKIFNDKHECVGVIYMGIFFTGKKGETMKNFIKENNLTYKHVFFIDDYEPYLIESTNSFPSLIAYRRMYP